jgi:hypothetical protein
MNEEILIPIFMFACIALILYKFFDVRHKERMTIIEKGLVSEDLKHLYSQGWKTNPYSSLKYGMLAAFCSVHSYLKCSFPMKNRSQPASFSCSADLV